MAFEGERVRMVDEQLRARGLNDARLLEAFRKVPRHLFVPPEHQPDAYADHPLPIGSGQTISQPYIVALMTDCLHLQGHERVLEIGAGSGYQTAILAELALEVYAVERLPELLQAVKTRLDALGCLNAQMTAGNGTLGWPEHAPYDAILVSAAAPRVPEPLVEQMAEQGRMVLPVGTPEAQMLVAVEKRRGRIRQTEIAGCLFVPLVGQHGWAESSNE